MKFSVISFRIRFDLVYDHNESHIPVNIPYEFLLLASFVLSFSKFIKIHFSSAGARDHVQGF